MFVPQNMYIIQQTNEEYYFFSCYQINRHGEARRHIQPNNNCSISYDLCDIHSYLLYLYEISIYTYLFA